MHRRALLTALLGFALATPGMAETRIRTRRLVVTGPRGTTTGTRPAPPTARPG